MTSEIKPDVNIEELIDPNLRETSMSKIKIFSIKAEELYNLSNKYEELLNKDSLKRKEILEETRKIFDHPDVIEAPLNNEIEEMNKLIMNYCLEAVENASTFRLWFSLQRPAITEQVIMSAEVMELVTDLAHNLESWAVEQIGQLNVYSNSRGKLLVKFFKFPYFEDFRLAIMKLEERQLEFIVMCMRELSSQYMALHDQVVKNFDKLKKPVRARQYAPDTI